MKIEIDPTQILGIVAQQVALQVVQQLAPSLGVDGMGDLTAVTQPTAPVPPTPPATTARALAAMTPEQRHFAERASKPRAAAHRTPQFVFRYAQNPKKPLRELELTDRCAFIAEALRRNLKDGLTLPEVEQRIAANPKFKGNAHGIASSAMAMLVDRGIVRKVPYAKARKAA